MKMSASSATTGAVAAAAAVCNATSRKMPSTIWHNMEKMRKKSQKTLSCCVDFTSSQLQKTKKTSQTCVCHNAHFPEKLPLCPNNLSLPVENMI